MIDYRKHRWVPLALIAGWLAWLFAMSAIGRAGLRLIDEDFWPRIIWVFAVCIATFGLPLFLLGRFTKRQSKKH